MKRHKDSERRQITLFPGQSDIINDTIGGLFDDPHALPRALYTSGTRILTVRGDVPVEHLGVGDVVLTAAGERICVRDLRRWSGGWHPGRLGGPAPWRVWPVRVRAGAFAPDMPRRDLLLGPDHAVLADGVLIPLRALIDGHAVRQVALHDVVYFTLEFAMPDTLLAEGLAVETHAPLLPAGDAPEDVAAATRPLVRSGLMVEAVRARIVRRRAA